MCCAALRCAVLCSCRVAHLLLFCALLRCSLVPCKPSETTFFLCSSSLESLLLTADDLVCRSETKQFARFKSASNSAVVPMVLTLLSCLAQSVLLSQARCKALGHHWLTCLWLTEQLFLCQARPLTATPQQLTQSRGHQGCRQNLCQADLTQWETHSLHGWFKGEAALFENCNRPSICCCCRLLTLAPAQILGLVRNPGCGFESHCYLALG